MVGCAEHRDLARSAVRASAVALVDNNTLPIPGGVSVLAAGVALDDIGICCGGWTITWAGGVGDVTAGTTILDGLRRLSGQEIRYDAGGVFAGDDPRMRYDYGVVAVHELPYVEGGGDRSDVSIPAGQLELVLRVRELVDRLVVVVVSGRPVLIEPIVEMADAVVAAWLPGSEADGVAETLLGLAPFTGRLPITWPRSVAQVTGEADATPNPSPWPVGHRAVTATTPGASL